MSSYEPRLPLVEDAPRRSLPPWVFVGGIAGGALLLIAVLAGITVLVAPPETGARDLQQVEMPDGTLLTLEQVTFGTRHEFTVEEQTGGFPLFASVRRRNFTEYTNGRERVMLWFSRRDRAGRPLDFDWWSHCVAIDEHGCRFEDDDAGRDAISGGSSSSLSGSRPFQPLGAVRRGPFDHIIAHSELPVIRHAGETFKLQVYNVAGDVVGEFDVRDPNPGPHPEWSPEPLPATKPAGDVEVELRSLTVRNRVVQYNGRSRERVDVTPRLEITQNGAPAPNWSNRNMALSDALGNRCQPWQCTLCPHEAAWKLSLQLFRTNDAEFAPSEIWTSQGLAIPAAKQTQRLGGVATVQGGTITLLAAGGSGRTLHTGLVPIFSGSHSTNIGMGEKPCRIETDGRGNESVTTVDCPLPHLIVKLDGYAARHLVTIKAVDDQGRPVETHDGDNAEMRFWFFEVAPDAKTLDVTVIVQELRHVEFLFEPPEIVAPAERG